MCSCRKIKSTHRWNRLDNCYFLTFIFRFCIYTQAIGKRKAFTIEVITQGSQPLTSNHDRKSISSSLLYSRTPLSLSAGAVRRRATASAERSQGEVPDCSPPGEPRLSNFLSSAGTTAHLLGQTLFLSHRKEMLLLKWWVSTAASLFFQPDTGCHFGFAESKIKS